MGKCGTYTDPAMGPSTGPRSGANEYIATACPLSSLDQQSESTPPPIYNEMRLQMQDIKKRSVQTARGALPPIPAKNRKMINCVSFFAKPQARFHTERAYQQKCNIGSSEKIHTKVKHICKLKYPGATVKFTEWRQEQWADRCAKISIARKKNNGFLTVRQDKNRGSHCH
jgi:hypothetical protein